MGVLKDINDRISIGTGIKDKSVSEVIGGSIKKVSKAVERNFIEAISNSDFVSRTIGMRNSYEGIRMILDILGHESVSLLGKDYLFIFDHVRRNYYQGTISQSFGDNDCPKFTFYKERPTVRFANPYEDNLFLLDRWFPNFETNTTLKGGTTFAYSESNDNSINNKKIPNLNANGGVDHGLVEGFGPKLSGCDLLKKTNDNFNYGKYKTLIARFHTNSSDSMDGNNPTQTAISSTNGMSHGRNLLKLNDDTPNGYHNPYCRVWTYHHQYNQLARAIRPFDIEGSSTKEGLENLEGGDENVTFRTSKIDGFDGGSARLDKYGVLNYKNGLVNIAPTAKISDYFNGKVDEKGTDRLSIKKCMFSIENLAWKNIKDTNTQEFDPIGLSAEQRGPFGGRIMWFPPYNLKLNESVSVDWNQNKFIGRGENIYTYTNTERSGSLGFTLLIDHPGIIDHWSGLDRNGKKNNGIPLKEGNEGGVDGKNNQEQTLLRFFAGCDILTASPQKYEKALNQKENPEDVKNSDPEKPDESEKPGKKIYAVLYYPNNYSGVDDNPDDAINYLMFGAGTQLEIKKDGRVEWFQPVVNAKDGIGYEMTDSGISIVTWDTGVYAVKDYIKYGTDKTKYPEYKIKEGVAEYIAYGPYNGEEKLFAKYLPKDKKKGASTTLKDSTSLESKWKDRRWYYRVDEDTATQQLTGKPYNYIDGKSYKMNSTGFGYATGIKEFNLSKDDLVSFAELYCALVPEARIDGIDVNRMVKLKSILNQQNGYKIKSIKFRGHNSAHGRHEDTTKTETQNEIVDKIRNSKLAKQRCNTFRQWMASKINGINQYFKKNEDGEDEALGQKDDKTISDSVDDQTIKAWRSAMVTIEYDDEGFSFASLGSENEDIVKTGLTKTLSDDVLNKAFYNSLSKKDQKKIRKQIKRNAKELEKTTRQTKKDNKKANNIVELESSVEEIESLEDLVSVKNQPDVEDLNKKNEESFTSDERTNVPRYDNEGEFFELLEKNDSFLHNLISQKVKYFDPAFHSISPEGFNARLTFLHQCTRQGSTVEQSAYDSSTAYNLSFGRPPVCVLRLGDFYYTKILITGVDIVYESPQWDLNPEGIGVMPMFADITLQFKFLGGSDLSGPIARLQNAVSFNYYANTGVYDNRAEKVEYDKRGNETAFKGYNYPLGRVTK